MIKYPRCDFIFDTEVEYISDGTFAVCPACGAEITVDLRDKTE